MALNSPKKGVGVLILGNPAGWKKQQSNRAEKSSPVEAKMSSTKEPTALFACSKCFTRHPFEELSQGQQLCKVNTTKIRKSCLFYLGNFSCAEKYADPVYKSSRVALTVKIGRLCNWANRIAETAGFFKSTNSLLKLLNRIFDFYWSMNFSCLAKHCATKYFHGRDQIFDDPYQIPTGDWSKYFRQKKGSYYYPMFSQNL